MFWSKIKKKRYTPACIKVLLCKSGVHRIVSGLRVLPAPDAVALLNKIEQFLSYSSFLTLEDHVRVLSGEEEGVFAWVAANYLKGFFWTNK